MSEQTLQCLQESGECSGEVEYRFSTSPSGRSFPRCDKHWSEHLQRVEGINRRYAPNSSVPPSDFDPSYAGESWDEDY